jgi:glucose/arabinose dehydrogenase
MTHRLATALFALFASIVALPALSLDSSVGELTVTEVAGDFDEPWGIGHLPDGGVLVTERGGAVIHLAKDGRRLSLKGVPEVVAEGQGGLLDIMIPRDLPRAGRFS